MLELPGIINLNGGGPQGGLWGILEYLSQSNNNSDHISPNRKFKFIDDLSILEIVNLMSIGLSAYNFRNHVASDVPISGLFIESRNLETQEHVNKICKWTEDNKMKLNTEKSKAMIFNFTNDHQFATRVLMNNKEIQEIQETKLLGVYVNNKLNWDQNTKFLVQKANAKMRLLHKLVKFGVPQEDLKVIYILYIRSHLEQSCQVWHSSLTSENVTDLERVQKNALRIILQERYLTYTNALEVLALDSLYDRREKLCLLFAKKCLKSKNHQVSSMFPLNDIQTSMETRASEKYHVNMAKTERYKNSSIPYMQRLLNNSK